MPYEESNGRPIDRIHWVSGGVVEWWSGGVVEWLRVQVVVVSWQCRGSVVAVSWQCRGSVVVRGSCGTYRV